MKAASRRSAPSGDRKDATADFLEDRHRADARCGIQHRHDIAVRDPNRCSPRCAWPMEPRKLRSQHTRTMLPSLSAVTPSVTPASYVVDST